MAITLLHDFATDMIQLNTPLVRNILYTCTVYVYKVCRNQIASCSWGFVLEHSNMHFPSFPCLSRMLGGGGGTIELLLYAIYRY